MLGAIIGDIIGSRFEFSAPPKQGFELFTPECDYTDDTICTVAVADAILHQKDYKQTMLEWCRRYPDPMGGYGTRFYHWLNSDDPQPVNSFGNGSAMRVSSVGWLFNDYDDIMEEAKRTAEFTHNHPEGIKGAQCVAALIYWLRTCRITKEETERSVRRSFGYEIMPLKDIFRIGSTGHFDGTCQETVPMAIRCFIDGTDFEDVVRKAILCDGDTDTKGDIAGAIAEAYYEIPDDFIRKACSYLPHDMLDIISEFTEAVGNHVTEG
ncbi:MAG: ADP-ribosylglycohydrolase family protein [Prevotella sp.]|nr:ADP-ribosylglycohydrolase family protein [Prevotella sp.]